MNISANLAYFYYGKSAGYSSCVNLAENVCVAATQACVFTVRGLIAAHFCLRGNMAHCRKEIKQ